MILTHTPQEVAGGFDSAGRPAPVDNGKMVTLLTEMVRGAEAAAEGVVQLATWSGLNSVAGTRIGQPGRVMGPDSGTHADPVVGGSVPNEGEYSWSASPAGWRRVGDTSINQLVAGQEDLLRSTRTNALELLGPTQGFMSEQDGWVGQPTVDAAGNVLAGVDTDFNFRARMLDAPGVPALTENYAYAWLTEDGYLLFGFTSTGEFVVGGIVAGVKAFAHIVDGKSCIFVMKDNELLVQITFGENDCYAPDVSSGSVNWAELSGETAALNSEDITAQHAFASSVDAMTHVLLYGQSLADGGSSVPVMTTSPVKPGFIATFNAGPRVRGAQQAEVPLPKSNIFKLVDLHEKVNETPASQLCNELAKDAPVTAGFVGTVHSRGGFSYNELKKGTIPFANLIATVRRARIVAALNGMSYQAPAVSWIQGEANRATALQTYLDYLIELQSDLASEIGRYVAGDVKLFVDQISNWTAYGLTGSDVPLAQLQASFEKPASIFCVGPKYHLETVADGIHLTGASSALLGAYHGRAIRQTLSGTPWVPLHVASALRVGAQVDLTFAGGDGEIVLDTVRVADPGNYGLVWRQTGGTPATISALSKTGPRTLRVTLSADPGAVTSQFIDIAMQAASGSPAGPTTGARSCIRDSSPDVDAFGSNMFNWACHQACTVTI